MRKTFIFSYFLYLSLSMTAAFADVSQLPGYIVVNDPNIDTTLKKILEQDAKELTFPLSQEDIEMIKILEAKYDAESNCAGLAAPQIGFNKQVIIFAIPDDPVLKKWRSDLEQTMPKSIWINPSYSPIEEDKKTVDLEACFSVRDLAGPVTRFTKIRYEAYLMDGTKVQGEATGFLARVLQHEIDHVHGILYTHRVPEGQLKSLEYYRNLKRQQMEEK